MKPLISFSLFQYKCIEFIKDQEIFTYKTDSKVVTEINKEFFSCLQNLNNSENILRDLFSKKNSHSVKETEKINLIIKIFESFGFKNAYIEQYIGSRPIYQIKIKSERRLFFILETKEIDSKEKIIIIKPLFLDINHVIYNDKRFPKTFNTCLICWKTKCNI